MMYAVMNNLYQLIMKGGMARKSNAISY